MIAGLAATMAGACGGPSTSSTSATTPPKTSSSSTAAGVPAVLAGVWHTRFQGGDQKLAFQEATYEVYTNPNDKAVGQVTVAGSRLTLSGSNTCDGAGTYEWSVTNGVLRFTPRGSDPCPRAQLLPGRAWKKVG